jgi:hypothetical protein
MNKADAASIRAHHNDIRAARGHCDTLRGEHPVFTFQAFDHTFAPKTFSAHFHYTLENGPGFTTRWEFQAAPGRAFMEPRKDRLQRLLFDLGLVESISYWKSACPPILRILPEGFDPALAIWWSRLFENGLGEFLFRNSLLPVPEPWIRFESTGTPSTRTDSSYSGNGCLVPVGGGKDSVVTLDLARALPGGHSAFLINPTQASRRCAEQAGYPVLTARRTLDPALLELNRQGFLNGHTPFSAMVAFATLLGAELAGHSQILLSNESSANEATVPGTHINHQYSKTLAFEDAFRSHCRARFEQGPEYFSFLRPLNELQIAGLFSRLRAYLPHFRSCNIGEKSDSWCGLCAKCLFVRIMLAPFLDQEHCRVIWLRDPLEQPELLPLFDQLAGLAPTKPFECVGTVAEVRAACALAWTRCQRDKQAVPLLLQRWNEACPPVDQPQSLLRDWDDHHHLPENHAALLRQSLKGLAVL